jgi:putative transposase
VVLRREGWLVAVLERLAELRGLPRSITVDHGPEFEGRVLDARAYTRAVRLSFIRPAKPIESAYIESFNERFNGAILSSYG